MSLQARKLSLIEWLSRVDDEQIIDKIEHLKKQKKDHGKTLKPLSLKAYQNSIEQSEKDIATGKVYAHEDVVKYVKRKR